MRSHGPSRGGGGKRELGEEKVRPQAESDCRRGVVGRRWEMWVKLI